jgi:hypothetical protein
MDELQSLMKDAMDFQDMSSPEELDQAERDILRTKEAKAMDVKEYETQLRYCAARKGVPDHLIGGLVRYIINGIEPGGFLEAVLCNDLKEAFARGDEDSLNGLRRVVMFLYNDTPCGCWGSREKYANWTGVEG